VNYNEMSAAQCADWLAERDGWVKVKTERGGYAWRKSTMLHDPCSNWGHPFPLTLDAAAGALLEPWRLVRLEVSKSGRALAVIYCESPEKWEHMSGPDELTARYRAAVAARMEEDK